MSDEEKKNPVQECLDTTEDWEQAQHAARLLEGIADDTMPGWLYDASGIQEVIDRLYETNDPNKGEDEAD